MHPKKEWLFRILLLLGTVLVCFGVLEVLFRLLPARTLTPATDPAFDRPKAFFYSDTARLHPWIKGATNILKVAVIGDSFTNGSGVPSEDTYGMRLERLLNLNADAPPAQVRIFARGGTSPTYQLRFLAKALEWKPDLVVHGLCLNDAEDWNNKEQHGVWKQATLPHPMTGWPRTLFGWSRTAQWLHGRLENWRAARAHRAYYFRLYDESYTGWDRLCKDLLHFQQACRDYGVDYVAVVWPIFTFSLNPDTYWLQPIHDQLNGFFEQSEIAHLDLLHTFYGKDPNRMMVIPGIDAHPSEIAHRMASEAIFAYLLDAGILDPAYQPNNSSIQTSHFQTLYGQKNPHAQPAPPPPPANAP